ncbi:MAG TPA: DUF1501 domain-containing protein [Phycisphaerales bacterium]|nr:DUF1501 domain-containing protein [Phycisphaerales bacterium]HMP38589.1 DUF1501 domain-containing protein [Phycisphaerales bacterium]
MPRTSIDRRTFLASTLAGASAALVGGPSLGRSGREAPGPAATADACIFIWLPGGIPQTDFWDPKVFTPYRRGMRGSELLGTAPPIPTAADGIRLGAGLPELASVMDKACLVRSLSSDRKFGAIHLRAQYLMLTGYLHPAGFKAPSIGAIVARSLGRRDPSVPPYIYIGRDIDTSDSERLFIAEAIGPGFLGPGAAPFMVPDATRGLATLEAAAGMSRERLDRRQALFEALAERGPDEIAAAERAQAHRRSIEEARAMMDSSVRRAFDYRSEEPAELIAAYDPAIAPGELIDPSYHNGDRFGHGLLLARRLVERGARFVQVEYQYAPFKGFDMHENGGRRAMEMARQVDRPIAQLVRDLDRTGLLDRTLVVIATEFGRTIASQPAAGIEPEGASESHTGEDLVIERESMYGFHGHFSSTSSMVFFGGGFRKGHVHGRTADRHPMIAVEDPVRLIDLHATLYAALGIAPDTAYVTEGRPVYVTQDGEGEPIAALRSITA